MSILIYSTINGNQAFIALNATHMFDIEIMKICRENAYWATLSDSHKCYKLEKHGDKNMNQNVVEGNEPECSCNPPIIILPKRFSARDTNTNLSSIMALVIVWSKMI